jgi:hypothetical protein
MRDDRTLEQLDWQHPDYCRLSPASADHVQRRTVPRTVHMWRAIHGERHAAVSGLPRRVVRREGDGVYRASRARHGWRLALARQLVGVVRDRNQWPRGGKQLEPTRVNDDRDAPLPGKTRYSRGYIVKVGIATLVVTAVAAAALYEPRYPTVVTTSGQRFAIFSSGHAISTKGHWSYLQFFTHAQDLPAINSETAELLRDVVEPMAERNKDSLLIISAIYKQFHAGVLFGFRSAKVYKFALDKGQWLNVAP